MKDHVLPGNSFDIGKEWDTGFVPLEQIVLVPLRDTDPVPLLDTDLACL